MPVCGAVQEEAGRMSERWKPTIGEIVDYADAVTSKIAQSLNWSAFYDNASVFLQTQNGSMLWNNTNAITDIVFALSAGNGTADSVVNLYGE